jgi:hypothetical protein
MALQKSFISGINPENKIILLIFILCFIVLFRPDLKGADQVGYYSWVRSFVIDHNLDIKNEFEYFHMENLAVKLNGVYHAQPWAIGCAILWLPFFLLAHLSTWSLTLLGVSIQANGYSFIYRAMVSLGTTCYALLGLLLTYKLLRLYFDYIVALLALISVWLASPLVFYMYSHPMMAHANDMFGYALVLFTWHRAYQSPRPFTDYLILGCAAGLSALIRTQNALLAVLCLIPLLLQVAKGNLKLKDGMLSLAIFSLAWWITFFPQLYVWHLTFGEWFPGVTSARLGAGEFSPGFPYVFQVLFSTNRGLFLWHPILFISFIGLFLLTKYDKPLFWFLLGSFLIQLGIIGSWQRWHGDNAFGQRFFVSLSPVFMFGLAALLQALKGKVSLKALFGLAGAFIVWNLLLILQYALETIPRCGPINLKELVVNQFLIIPTHFRRILAAWGTRS